MKKIVRLTERDLTRIVKRVLQEEESTALSGCENKFLQDLKPLGDVGTTIKKACLPDPTKKICLDELEKLPSESKKIVTKALAAYNLCKTMTH